MLRELARAMGRGTLIGTGIGFPISVAMADKYIHDTEFVVFSTATTGSIGALAGMYTVSPILAAISINVGAFAYHIKKYA